MNLTVQDKVLNALVLGTSVDIVVSVFEEIVGEDISGNAGEIDLSGDALTETVVANIQANLGVVV